MAKILLIDDDVDFSLATVTLLKSKGHEVVTAGNSDEGYAKALKEKPQLLLLDVMMGGDDDGFILARKFKEAAETSGIPIILLTGIKQAKGLPFSYEPDSDWLPVKTVLDKPVKPELLFKAVEEGLKR